MTPTIHGSEMTWTEGSVTMPLEGEGPDELVDNKNNNVERSLWRIEQLQLDIVDRLRRLDEKQDRALREQSASKGSSVFDQDLIRTIVIALASAIVALVGGQALIPRLFG